MNSLGLKGHSESEPTHVVKFEMSRKGDSVTVYLNGRQAFPDRNWDQDKPEEGDEWEVRVSGGNPKGTVWFLMPIKRVGLSRSEREKERKQEEERERIKDEKNKKEVELQFQENLTMCVEELKKDPYLVAWLTEEEMKNLAHSSAIKGMDGNGLKYNWDKEEALILLMKNSRYEAVEKDFASRLPELEKSAQGLAEKYRGLVKRPDFWFPTLGVQIVADPETISSINENYEQACGVDQHLALRGLLQWKNSANRDDSKYGYVGKYSGAIMHKFGNWGDLFVSEGYAEREPPDNWDPDPSDFHIVDEPNKPQVDFIIWSAKMVVRETPGVNGEWGELQIVDNTSLADEKREGFNKDKVRWEGIAETAKIELEEILAKEKQEKEEKEEARKFLLDLIKKMDIPRTSPDSSPLETTWIGLPATATAWHDHTGTKVGAFINRSCVVHLPGGKDFNISRPGDSWPDDVRSEASLIKESWEKFQPEGALIPYETPVSAYYRLTGFPYNPDKLPQIGNGIWETNNYSEATLWDKELEKRFPEIPEIPKIEEEDKNICVTHRLILFGKGIMEIEVGSVGFFKSKQPGYYAEIRGPLNDFWSCPENKIRDFLKENPDADPRVLDLRWESVG